MNHATGSRLGAYTETTRAGIYWLLEWHSQFGYLNSGDVIVS